jgi:hypothetical protein
MHASADVKQFEDRGPSFTGVNEHFESIYNAVSCQLRVFKTASYLHKRSAHHLPAFLFSDGFRIMTLGMRRSQAFGMRVPIERFLCLQQGQDVSIVLKMQIIQPV